MIPLSWTPIESSLIRKVRYLPNTHDARGDLLVEFNEGKKYRFKDVQEFKVERLVHNSSPGQYFRDFIRSEHASERWNDDE